MTPIKLPSPTAQWSGCMWLPRIVAKARLLKDGALPADYVARFCHPSGVDGQFIGFFGLNRDEIIAASEQTDDGVAKWFTSLPGVTGARIEAWNTLAVNLGRPGFPMAERMPIAMATTYEHLRDRVFATVFEVLRADEADAG